MLGQYRFKIVYTLGKDNGRADALSWRHDIAGTKEIINTAILKVNNNGLLGLARTLNLLIKVTYEVLEELHEAIIRQHYDDPVHSYPSIARTIELIKRNYEFLGIKDKIASFIAKCVDC
jgi:hypothetical protein